MTAYHEAHFTEHPARAAVWRAIARHLAGYVPASAHVLELGAGYCHWINHVAAARRVAVDAWGELPRHAGAGVEARVLDLTHGLGPFGARAFDVVLASNLLEHFAPDEAAALARDVAGVLRPGGRVILIQPNFRYAFRRYFDDYTHRAVFTDVSLPALLRASGFAIDEVRPRFLPYSMRGAPLAVPGWLVTAYLRSPVKPFAGQMLVVGRTM
jgi:SAM-dependent methyltransferase